METKTTFVEKIVANRAKIIKRGVIALAATAGLVLAVAVVSKVNPDVDHAVEAVVDAVADAK